MNKGLLTLFAVTLPLANWAQSGGELRFTIPSDPTTFDPLQVTEESADAIRYLTAGTLVRLDRRTFQPKPELAESWKVLDKGRRIVFKLRAGIRFSDGSPLDAEDVAYTLRRILDPQTHLAAGDNLRPEKGSPEVVVLNKQEVSLLLPAPVSGLAALFDAIPILSARSPLKEKAALGPFVLTEYKVGSFVRLRKNVYFWKRDDQGRQLPYLDSVRIDIQQNREIELTKFLRGEVDFISSLAVDAFVQIGEQHGASDTGPTFDSEFIWFNQAASAPLPHYKKAWFQSAAFRRALSQAINRDDIVKLVYHGRATSAGGPFSPSAKPWADMRLKPPAFDPDGALKILASDGFTRQGTTLKDRTGRVVEFSLITNSGNQNRAKIAALLQQDLGRLGITLNIVTLDMPSLIERITRSSQYEACLLGFVGTNLDPNDQLNLWLSSSSAHCWNPGEQKPATDWESQIDDLMRDQYSTSDQSRRKSLIDQFQAIVYAQAPIIYLVHPHALMAISPRIANAQPSILRPRVFWNVEQLYLVPGQAAKRNSQ